MPVKLWRCLNPECHDGFDGPPVFDFENETGECPTCKNSPKTAPQKIAERATIHYLKIDPAGPVKTPNGSRRVACQPLLRRLPTHCTGEPSAVTCPACKADADVAANVVQHQAITADAVAAESGE